MEKDNRETEYRTGGGTIVIGVLVVCALLLGGFALYKSSNVSVDNVTGPQGIQGEKGAKGDKGDKGDTGGGSGSIAGPRGVQGVQGPVGPVGPVGPQGPAGTEVLGGSSSNFNTQDLTVNGVTQHFYSCAFANLSTSTACSFRTPSASTTIQYLASKLTANTGRIASYFGKGATSWATSTALLTLTGTAGTTFTGFASSTLTSPTLLPDAVLPPNVWVNLGYEGTGFATGTAKMILREI